MKSLSVQLQQKEEQEEKQMAQLRSELTKQQESSHHQLTEKDREIDQLKQELEGNRNDLKQTQNHV